MLDGATAFILSINEFEEVLKPSFYKIKFFIFLSGFLLNAKQEENDDKIVGIKRQKESYVNVNENERKKRNQGSACG